MSACFSSARKWPVLGIGVVASLLAVSVLVLPQNSSVQAAAPATGAATAPTADQHGPTIKDTYKGHFLIGTAADLTGFSDAELGLIKENFNIITPENCMKPGPIHPQEDQYDWTTADNLVKFGTENNIAIHGHTLVWHSQTGGWFFQGGDKATIIKRLQTHIATVVGRYKGKIKSWDVVNEAINDGGAQVAGSENLRNSQWLQTIGPEFIEIAFKAAHEADPDAHLYYNDYTNEYDPKLSSNLALLKRLIKNGTPIYGVGLQGHWTANGPSLQNVDKAITAYAALGLKVSISELDITVNGSSGGQLGPAGGGRRGRAGAPDTVPATTPAGARADDDEAMYWVTAPGSAPGTGTAPGGRGARGAGGAARGGRGGSLMSAETAKIQADAYAKAFAIFEKHKADIERVTFWGLNDRRSWRSGENPLILDANNMRKPAYVAIVEQLLHPDPNLAPPP